MTLFLYLKCNKNVPSIHSNIPTTARPFSKTSLCCRCVETGVTEPAKAHIQRFFSKLNLFQEIQQNNPLERKTL